MAVSLRVGVLCCDIRSITRRVRHQAVRAEGVGSNRLAGRSGGEKIRAEGCEDAPHNTGYAVIARSPIHVRPTGADSAQLMPLALRQADIGNVCSTDDTHFPGNSVSQIQRLLQGNNQQIDFDNVLNAYPWLSRRRQRAILSPDSDGLLCGLLMSALFDWEVVGFYDGKVLLVRDGVNITDDDVAFLDIEVFRSEVKSIGHHMLLFNNRHIPPNWSQFANCLQPNLLRNYAAKTHFRLKYPLATIHLILALIGRKGAVTLPRTAVQPLLFTDGAFNVLYSYPENVLNWLSYLRIEDADNPLRTVFVNPELTVYETMREMDDFFRKRDSISVRGERGDRLRISTTDGSPFNLIPDTGSLYRIDAAAKQRALDFIELLSKTTGWLLDESKWSFDRLTLRKLEKSSFQREKWSLTNPNFAQFMRRNPVSWAMTSGTDIEFTLPGALPFP